MDWFRREIATLSIHEVTARIVERNESIRDFWSQAHGWAPLEAAQLLSGSRLDRQASLSQSLYRWHTGPGEELSDGDLILAWTNLGALLEGTMKWFLSVYYKDFKASVDNLRNRRLAAPDGLTLEQLRVFFAQNRVLGNDEYDGLMRKVQQRRNAIHAFKHRELGSKQELEESIREYLVLLEDLDGRVPYPWS